jgi:hypothetical protein
MGKPQGGKPGVGQLYTARADFRDFHARLEVKSNGGYSALLFNGLPGVAMNGASVTFSNDAKTGVGVRFNTNMGIATRSAPLPATVKPDDWFTLEVVAQAPKVIYRIHGETVLEVPDAQSRPGPVGFEVAGPGTVLSVRKIEIKELPPGKNLPADALRLQGTW